jgi:hypothetical protein
MIDVARFLNLVKEKGPTKLSSKMKPSNARDADAEKRKLRKELEKLTKQHQKAAKTLDDFRNEQMENRYPVDDDVVVEEIKESGEANTVSPLHCPAARVPDLEGFPGIPDYCLPDLLMVWDFLCTFQRTINLLPIQLEDFVAALTFQPPDMDDAKVPTSHQTPVYLAEAHLGLLKLLLVDKSSDNWWWSVLESDELDQADGEEAELAATIVDEKMPVIKIDFAALLAHEEDPLITASWLQALEVVRSYKAKEGRKIKQAVKTAHTVAANPWVKAYIKKSLTDWKPDFALFTKRAVIWLIDHVREARPELFVRGVSKKAIIQARAAIVDAIAILMEKMDDSGDVVAVEDLDSDDEDESDDESNEDGDNETDQKASSGHSTDESEKPVHSAIPSKPPPSLVDLLLPPAKPYVPSDLVNSFTWPYLAGASVARVLHRYKRIRNEVDDMVRDSRGLPPMTISERKLREEDATCRVLSECAVKVNSICPIEKAAELLSKGGHYLQLTSLERLCILKVLVDAAYDSISVHEVIDSNHKQRLGAAKAVDAEERRAKREAREEALAADQAAREKLASDARSKFLDEKREELRKLNQATNEYSYTVIDELTEEDIIEFDDDSKAEYSSLPTPQSFSKTEVNEMVQKMQEQAAFNADSVAVISMDEIARKDADELREMEAELANLSSFDTYNLGREGTRRLDRLRRDIEQMKENADNMPDVRESALEMLREAIEDGTVKSLKTAIKVAKQAKLTGQEYSTGGGIWTVDLLRDAALELKSAERRKRVIEAKKDLVAKMNKCFIRTDPLGQDRFRNSFWHFENDGAAARVWVEAQYVPQNVSRDLRDGYVNLSRNLEEVGIGAPEKEEDLLELHAKKEEKQEFLNFSRKEFHRSGQTTRLTLRYWGGHATEKALKGLAKNLDDRGTRERELKAHLKETLEQSGLGATTPVAEVFAEDGEDDMGVAEKQPEFEAADEHQQLSPKPDEDKDEGDEKDEKLLTTGDGDALVVSIKAVELDHSVISVPLVSGLTTAIGSRVRVREEVDSAKQNLVAHYRIGNVVGWKFREESLPFEAGLQALNGGTKTRERPVWKVVLDRGGGEVLLNGKELLESICRYRKWKSHDKGYFEHDAAFLSYRNSMGRHCGKAADAGFSETPTYLARLMVRREQDLYTSMKNLTYDNTWGGKSGARNAWITSMRDECYDLETAKTGLLTMETAFFELTGEFPESMAPSNRSAREILEDPSARFDIELESIEKSTTTLWNSRQSRDVFLEIIRNSKTTGFLALGLDLLCRNCWAYVEASKPRGRSAAAATTSASAYELAPGRRSTRRMNAWQQMNEDWF